MNTLEKNISTYGYSWFSEGQRLIVIIYNNGKRSEVYIGTK